MSFRIEDVPQIEQKIHFHVEQLKWLEKMFPEIIHTPNSTPAEMYYSSGARRVLEAVRARVSR